MKYKIRVRTYGTPYLWKPWVWLFGWYLLADDWIAYKRGRAHYFPWGER